jgi:hypothetical protein
VTTTEPDPHDSDLDSDDDDAVSDETTADSGDERLPQRGGQRVDVSVELDADDS